MSDSAPRVGHSVFTNRFPARSVRRLCVGVVIGGVWVGGLVPRLSLAQELGPEDDLNLDAVLERLTQAAEEPPETPALSIDTSLATTTDNPEIPLPELQLLLKPLTLEELQIEAAAWFLLLRDHAIRLSTTELAVARENRRIAETQDAAKALEQAEIQLERTQDATEAAGTGTASRQDPERTTKQAQERLEAALAEVEEAAQVEAELADDAVTRAAVAEAEDDLLETEAMRAEEEAAAVTPDTRPATLSTQDDDAIEDVPRDRSQSEILQDEGVDAVQANLSNLEVNLDSPPGTANPGDASPGTANPGDASPAADPAAPGDAATAGTAAASVEEATATLADAQDTLEAKMTERTEVKKELLFNLTELRDQEIATAERFRVVLAALEAKGGDTEVYRAYVNTVNAIQVDASDSLSFWIMAWGWLRSEQGGRRWAQKLLRFGGTVGGFVILAFALSKVTERSLGMAANLSTVFRRFLVNLVWRSTNTIGVLVGLTALDVSLGPLLALLGGVSFILAFALQHNLGNFASGLMILFYKPFDVGDEIKVDAVWGRVEAISLANTKVRSFNHHLITVPNTTVWESIIINFTHDPVRQVTLTLAVDQAQDLKRLRHLLVKVACSHPRVLPEPQPQFVVEGYGEGTVQLKLGVWVRTEDHWPVHTQLHYRIQQQLQAAQISWSGSDLGADEAAS
ncbi:MAG: mechanosensitive ion channel family protein [Prochlorothrix sp.]|nr:mechanosensitive ion channel family protein [Prochlorothrix sp.]